MVGVEVASTLEPAEEQSILLRLLEESTILFALESRNQEVQGASTVPNQPDVHCIAEPDAEWIDVNLDGVRLTYPTQTAEPAG